jgi:predicted secreted protein
MSIALGIAIYIVIWWTVLFAMLPIGVRTQGEDGAIVPGTPESAPTAPRLLRVVLLTTAIATLIFLLPWAVTRYGLVDLGAWVGRNLPK